MEENFEKDYQDYYSVEYCPDCDSPLIEKREQREDGLVEYVWYCENCGLTSTN